MYGHDMTELITACRGTKAKSEQIQQKLPPNMKFGVALAQGAFTIAFCLTPLGFLTTAAVTVSGLAAQSYVIDRYERGQQQAKVRNL
jgi:hypothetical protein